MIVYYSAAVPSLISLSVLCFLPWTCRRCLSLWRALQAYDKQPVVTTDLPPYKISLWLLFAAIGIPLWSMLLIIMLGVTAGGDWHNGWPVFASIRDAIPRLFLVGYVLIGIASLTTTLCKPLLSASRFVGLNKTQAPLTIQYAKNLSSNGLPRGCNLFAIQMIAAITITWAALSISSQTAMPMIMASSCIFVTLELSTFPPTMLSHLSFRGFVLVPFFCAAYQTGMALLSNLFVYLIAKFFDINDVAKAIKSSHDSPSSWGIAKMFEDVDATQAFFSLGTFIFGFAAWFTCALVALAYRYDADQANLCLLTAAEADMLIEQSTLPADRSGRTPILLRDAALSPSKLTPKQLPTYRAAYHTMLGIQIFGIAFDALTGWQPGTFYPTREDQLIDIGNPFSISVWPFVAYPFVALAMVISVRRNPDRSFRSLWSCHEKWHIEPATNDKPVEEDASEELLEFGKRGGDEWVTAL